MTVAAPAVSLHSKIRKLQGPILVLGGSGFIGANLLHTILDVRTDAVGTTTRTPAWRLADLAPQHVREVDLLVDANLDALLESVKPRTIFDCVAYGAYSFETDSEEVIRQISRNDRRVTGISHSRNFGSQAAFRSGMEVASKNSVVLLDGDLQDPPEVIEQFVAHWREGYDVVYGRRIKRHAPLHMQVAYKIFYRLFDKFSYLRIPHDAGDFSLLDKRVVASILEFPERDFFLRGVRAFVGYKQIGVDYVRPERMFGVTTNSLLKNIGWAKKGILSFSNAPLNMLSAFGVLLLLVSIGLAIVQVIIRLLLPTHTPAAITTVLLEILFFGAINIFALGLIGEYIAKIFEEVKQRPRFIRRSFVRDGEVRSASGEDRSQMASRSVFR